MTGLTYRYAAMTDTGLRRSENQDSGYASGRLLVVADGMGGAAAGDLASATTMNTVRQLDGAIDGDPAEALVGAVLRANTKLGELIADDPAVEGMGTTLTALLFDGDEFTMAHIGDSRGYRLRDDTLTQITDDHTFVQSLVDEGRISREEAREHPHRSLILRALLGRDDNDPDISTVEPQIGDRYLLCSDGLPDMVRDELIEQTMRLESVDQVAVELIRLALEGGGVDNVTVVVAEIVDADQPIDEELSSANGQPQLVGAAAGEPRPRTGRAARASSAAVPAGEPVDPEELRYAPRPPSRRRWVRRILVLLVLAAVVAGGATLAYGWSQEQYFVGDDGGKVTIFQGIQVDVPGVRLHQVERQTSMNTSALPVYNQKQVRDGIETSSLSDAEETITRLEDVSGLCDSTRDAQACDEPELALPPDEEPTENS